MIHRHLSYPPETAPQDLPLAALVDILHRGDLEDWLPLLTSVTADPHGPLADAIDRLVDEYPAYGTSPLWRSYLERCRAATSRDGLTLSGLRLRNGLSQTELANRIGMSQSDLSKLERRSDVRISTLRAYVKALGAKLQLLVRSPHEVVELELGPAEDPVDPDLQGRR